MPSTCKRPEADSLEDGFWTVTLASSHQPYSPRRYSASQFIGSKKNDRNTETQTRLSAFSIPSLPSRGSHKCFFSSEAYFDWGEEKDFP
jgi:hypothetical protein